jgi:hypothetical protein
LRWVRGDFQTHRSENCARPTPHCAAAHELPALLQSSAIGNSLENIASARLTMRDFPINSSTTISTESARLPLQALADINSKALACNYSKRSKAIIRPSSACRLALLAWLRRQGLLRT